MNIGEYLGEDGGFECAFWTTYSIDFSTTYFILNQHIRPLIQGKPCYIMVDLRKLHDACQADDDLKALAKLQSKGIISACDRRVAFHPKLLFLAGDTKLRLIVTSGNATAYGVLSDADLIARFDYDKRDSTHKEATEIIAEAFRFLKSCPGWHPDALHTLEKVQTRHQWLDELGSELFLGTHKAVPLFEQMFHSLTKTKVTRIEIYSPFYDPTLAALRRFRDSFPKIPIEAWAGAGFVELDDACSIDLLGDLGISLHRPLFKGRDSFHAKVYRFVVERDSIVFWGSANCSNSALLSTRNSSEILVRTVMLNKEFTELFDPLPSKPISDAQVRSPSRKDEETDALPFKITSATIDEGQLSLTALGIGDFSVRVRGSSGQEMASKVLSPRSAEASVFTVDISQAAFKILAIELVDRFNTPVSNRFPVNNLDYINASEDTGAINLKRKVEEGGPEAINLIEKYFTFERGGLSSSPEKGSHVQRDFWNATSGSHNTVWSAGYLSMSYSAQARLAEAESDAETDETTERHADQAKRDKPLVYGWPWSQNLNALVLRNHKRLLKNLKEGVQPNEDRWATGLEHFVRYLINPLVEVKADLGEDEVYDFAEVLLRVAEMVAYFTYKKALTRDELNKEGVVARLTTFAKVIDFSYFFATADIEIYREFHSDRELRDDHPESMQRQIRAGFLRTWIYAAFSTLNATFREQNLADLEDTRRCLRRAKAASRAFQATQRFSGSIAALPIPNPDEGVAFTHPKYGPMLIERWLGRKVDCCSLLGETKTLATGFLL